MSADWTRNPLNEGAPTTQVALNRLPAPPVDPELLRWRAEMLMDEMMLGGVDVGASPVGMTNHRELVTPARTTVPKSHQEMYQNGEPPAVEHLWSEPGQNGAYRHSLPTSAEPTSSGYQPDPQYRDRPYKERNEHLRQPPSTASGATPPPEADSEHGKPGQQQWLFAAEERYKPATRPSQTSTDAAPRRDTLPPRPEPVWMGDEPAAPMPGDPPVSNGPGYSEPPTATTDAVRRVSTQFTTVLSSTNIGVKRSNLLPRMSSSDVEAMQKEIYTLYHEIDTLLPAGHESSKQARRLLEKAQTILASNELRSAEVEYYLHQVRTIFQRVQQISDWSSLYRNRLTVYLSAWLMLGLVVILGRYLYPTSLENFVRTAARLADDSLVIQHLCTVLSTFFAGAFGGALGALINLRNQSKLPYGFVDRKFGLRGLILPLMGAIVGLLLYLPLGLLYFLFSLNPAQNLLFSSAPVLLAFLFGISQESLYGTRE